MNAANSITGRSGRRGKRWADAKGINAAMSSSIDMEIPLKIDIVVRVRGLAFLRMYEQGECDIAEREYS